MKCTLTFNIETIMIHIENGIFNANETEGCLNDFFLSGVDSHKLSFAINIHTRQVHGCFWQIGF